MENTEYRNQPRKVDPWLGFWGGLLLLIVGGVIGILSARYYWQGTRAVASVASPPLANASLTTLPAVQPILASDAQWDPVKQLNAMQTEIDQVFQRSFAQFKTAQPEAIAAKPGYSLSMDVRDLKNKYQVLAFLPETKPSDVKVDLNGDQLKVSMDKEVTEKPTAKNGETAMTEWGNYEETVHLAGPLKDSQMKVERLPHELIISVPKV